HPRAFCVKKVDRLIRAYDNHRLPCILIIGPPACEIDNLGRSWREENSNRAPAEVDRVDAVGKREKMLRFGLPPTGAVSKVAVEGLPRLRAGRSKSVGAEAAQALMHDRIKSDQPAINLVVVPDFLAWHRFARASHVEPAAVSVTPVERRFHS